MISLTLHDMIQLALKEDMPEGDLTTESMALDARPGIARLTAKEDLVLSGRSIFEEVIQTLEPEAELTWYFNDSDLILKGQQVVLIQGDLIQILKAERVALNFLGSFSGIATLTRCFVDQVKHTSTQILDTRKTTPLYRDLEKRAVRDGGGINHRLNLSDAVMVKDNHIRAAGGITEAVTRIRRYTKKTITVEVTNFEEAQEAIGLRVNRLLLDNMSNELTKKVLEIVPPKIETEASGNMTVERVRAIAELGVNYISVGLITHSAPTADFSLLFDWT